MDADRISRSMARIAHEVLERNRGVEALALVGIRSRGVPLAARIARELKHLSGTDVPTGALDITLYRDDLMRHAVGPQPVIRRTEIPFSIDDRVILLVDDVLYTGRTIRAALDALIDFGRPAPSSSSCWSTAATAAADQADYVGRTSDVATRACGAPLDIDGPTKRQRQRA
jgi:pyrimidine operon attenuation protein/uracil phosphoribosyltransferase